MRSFLLLTLMFLSSVAGAMPFANEASENFFRKSQEAFRERREAGLIRITSATRLFDFAKSEKFKTYENLRSFNERFADELCLVAYGRPIQRSKCFGLRVASKSIPIQFELVLHSGTVISLGQGHVVAGYTFTGTGGRVPKKIAAVRQLLNDRLMKWQRKEPSLNTDLSISLTGERGRDGFADFSYIEYPSALLDVIQDPMFAAQIRLTEAQQTRPRMAVEVTTHTKLDQEKAPWLGDGQPVIASLSRQQGELVRIEPVYGVADYGISNIRGTSEPFGKVSRLAQRDPAKYIETLRNMFRPLSLAIDMASQPPKEKDYAQLIAETAQVSQSLRYLSVINPDATGHAVRNLVALKGAIDLLRSEPPTARDGGWRHSITREYDFVNALDALAKEIDDSIFNMLSDRNFNCEKKLL